MASYKFFKVKFKYSNTNSIINTFLYQKLAFVFKIPQLKKTLFFHHIKLLYNSENYSFQNIYLSNI